MPILLLCLGETVHCGRHSFSRLQSSQIILLYEIPRYGYFEYDVRSGWNVCQTAQPDLCGFFRTFALEELEEKSLDASLHQTQIRSLLS